MKLRSRSDTPPVQGEMYSTSEMPADHFCWVIHYRVWVNGYEISPDAMSGWSDWKVVTRPSHFRHEEAARSQADFLRNHSTIKIEYRVKSKYIGYIPAKDEQWIV